MRLGWGRVQVQYGIRTALSIDGDPGRDAFTGSRWSKLEALSFELQHARATHTTGNCAGER